MMRMAPMLSEYVVVPLPVPITPAMRQPSPSTATPLLTACLGSGPAPVKKTGFE